MTQVSVILCTYNRSFGLERTLKSLDKQILPMNLLCEIVIVDNNSTDDTKIVSERFAASSNMKVRYVYEPKQGLSYARNKGVLEADGDYVFFIDDDEIADERLISEVYKTFETYGCDCVGGKIGLWLQRRIPGWLTRELWGFLGHLDYGDEVFQMDEERYPFGGNMAFSREIFRRIGLFNVNMGRRGRQLFGGAEFEFFMRLLDAGGNGMYQPRAVIYHAVDPRRLKKEYFRKLHYSEGLQKARLDERHTGFRGLHGVPLFLFSQFSRAVLIFLREVAFRGWDRSLRKEMILWHFLGLMKGYYQREGS